jgi:hypothetical protein
MENYLNNYDTLTKKIVYNFSVGDGGIGDLTKFFMHLLNICIKYNIKIHYLLSGAPIENYLVLKYPKMYISQQDISNNIINIDNITDIENIQSNSFYIVTPYLFYSSFSFDTIYSLQDVFCFSEEVVRNANRIFPDNANLSYIVLHLRLGDKHLETDPQFIHAIWEERSYNQYSIYNFIERCYNKNIVFFCDNRSYKLQLKKKYDNIIITDCEIGHTSLLNTTDIQILNTVSEFYLMTQAQHIFIASYSGFPIMAGKFKNIPVNTID